MSKASFSGKIMSIQPRIRLLRSFDEASHTYLGYAIQLEMINDGQHTSVSVGIGKAAHEKHQFKVNDVISCECVPVQDPDLESVNFYKVSKLVVINRGEQGSPSAPWEQVPPELEVYRERGHRRLAAITYETKCSTCMWGARMPVEIIVDNWNPNARRQYRFETFCYGPLSCPRYKSGPKRKVEGRKGMVYIEEDWVDEMNVEHRDPDE